MWSGLFEGLELLHLQDNMEWLELLRLGLAGWERTGNAGSRFYELHFGAKEGLDRSGSDLDIRAQSGQANPVSAKRQRQKQNKTK